MQPIPGRECGGCTQCCIVPPIDAPEFQKPPGVVCAHCTPGIGCRIYSTRPAPCRAFECGWRLLPIIPGDLRPDLSGILAVADEGAVPPGYRDMTAIKFIITGGVEALQRTSFLECLAGLIHARAPVFLAVPGPPGYFFAKVFLNDKLADAVANRDAKAMAETLVSAMVTLQQGAFEPATFTGES